MFSSLVDRDARHQWENFFNKTYIQPVLEVHTYVHVHLSIFFYLQAGLPWSIVFFFVFVSVCFFFLILFACLSILKAFIFYIQRVDANISSVTEAISKYDHHGKKQNSVEKN